MKSSMFLSMTALTALMFAAGSTATPTSAGEIRDCMKGSPQIAIHGCTRIIDTGIADGKRVSAKNMAKTYRKRGTAYSKRDLHRRAIADFDRSLELEPGYALAYGHRGWAYYKLGEYDQAIKDYTKAIELNPTLARAYHDLGWIHSELRNFDQSITHYTLAIKIKPVYPRAYLNRGVAHARNGQHDAAIADYTRAIELKPQYTHAYAGRGRSYQNKGQLERAIADYNIAVELDPKRASTYNDRGQAYRKKGQYVSAIRDYTKAIQLRPRYAFPYSNRALTRLKIDKPSLALRDIDKALRLNAKDARAFALRGKIHEALGQTHSAIADYRKALDLDASLVQTRQALNKLSYGGSLTQGTQKVVFIPGTTVGLVPPPGFELGTNFAGFKHEDRGITISVLELPAQTFVHMKAGFSEGTEAVNKKFAAMGLTASTITPVNISGAEGLVIAATQTLGGKKTKLWMLVLGGKSATAIFYVSAPIDRQPSDAKVTAVLDSIRFRDPPSLQNQIDILPYRFGAMAGFRVWRTMFGNMALLTNSPNVTPMGENQPMIIVMRLKCVYSKDTTPAQFSEQFFSEFKDFTVTEIHKTVEITVAGADGYELTATGIDGKTKKPVNITLRFRYEAGHLLGVLAIFKSTDHKVLQANLRTLAANLRNK